MCSVKNVGNTLIVYDNLLHPSFFHVIVIIYVNSTFNLHLMHDILKGINSAKFRTHFNVFSFRYVFIP